MSKEKQTAQTSDATVVRVEPEFERWIKSFNPEGQIQCRKDLEACDSFEERFEIYRYEQINRMQAILDLIDEWEKPWYRRLRNKVVKWLNKIIEVLP